MSSATSPMNSPTIVPRGDASSNGSDRSFLSKTGTLTAASPHATSPRGSAGGRFDSVVQRRTNQIPHRPSLGETRSSVHSESSTSGVRRGSKEAGSEQSILLIKVHAPRNLKIPGSQRGNDNVYCTVAIAGSNSAVLAKEHVVASFPSDEVTLNLSSGESVMENSSVQVRFWVTDMNPVRNQDRKLVAETCLPCSKLREYGVTTSPIWMPFWLGLFPAGHPALAGQKHAALFDEAMRLAEDIQHQKICVDVNASKCANFFPPSSSELQRAIIAYNRQIESYHQQTEDESFLSLGNYVYLQNRFMDAPKFKLTPAGLANGGSPNEDDAMRTVLLDKIQDLARTEEQLANVETTVDVLTSELRAAEVKAVDAERAPQTISELQEWLQQSETWNKVLLEEYRELDRNHQAMKVKDHGTNERVQTAEEQLQVKALQLAQAEADLQEKLQAKTVQFDHAEAELQDQLQAKTLQLAQAEAELQAKVSDSDALAKRVKELEEMVSQMAVQQKQPSAVDGEMQTDSVHISDSMTEREEPPPPTASPKELEAISALAVAEEKLKEQEDRAYALEQENREMAEELSQLRKLASSWRNEESQLRRSLGESVVELENQRKEVQTIQAHIEILKGAEATLADNLQHEKLKCEDEQRLREELTTTLQGCEAQLQEEQNIANRHKIMLERANQELLEQAEKLEGLVPASQVNSLRAELKVSMEAVKAERAECVRLREALAMWDNLGARMGSHLQAAVPSEDLDITKASDTPSSSTSHPHPAGNPLDPAAAAAQASNADTAGMLKAIFKEIRSAYQQYHHQVQQGTGPPPPVEPVLRPRWAETKVSPRGGSDAAPIPDHELELMVLKQEVMDLRETTAQLEMQQEATARRQLLGGTAGVAAAPAGRATGGLQSAVARVSAVNGVAIPQPNRERVSLGGSLQMPPASLGGSMQLQAGSLQTAANGMPAGVTGLSNHPSFSPYIDSRDTRQPSPTKLVPEERRVYRPMERTTQRTQTLRGVRGSGGVSSVSASSGTAGGSCSSSVPKVNSYSGGILKNAPAGERSGSAQPAPRRSVVAQQGIPAQNSATPYPVAATGKVGEAGDDSQVARFARYPPIVQSPDMRASMGREILMRQSNGTASSRHTSPENLGATVQDPGNTRSSLSNKSVDYQKALLQQLDAKQKLLDVQAQENAHLRDMVDKQQQLLRDGGSARPSPDLGSN
eukprot:CAMPEP_0178379592 /NCGR_PEP_ID=MMETSP0689_2-20121128/5024_1 /TAXON_ID=160604 /ORGANISM="Amphidinium massartii, Strain CS-259" /LENGTH=1203 /DNA_ID=CAMNT_0019999703 /DNA_START=180 /DNA_END=3788 /DNA_ORIENTATION=-